MGIRPCPSNDEGCRNDRIESDAVINWITC